LVQIKEAFNPAH